MFRIRRFFSEDSDGVARVFKSWWAGENGKCVSELLRDAYFDAHGFLIAERNGEVIGFSYAYVDPRVVHRFGYRLGFLAGVFAFPKFRGTVDVELLKKSLEYLKTINALEVEVPDFPSTFGNGVTAEKDAYFYRLYRGFGFSINMHSYTMSRSLEKLKIPRWLENRNKTLTDEGIILRKAKKEDVPSLVTVEEEAFKEAYDYIPKTKKDIKKRVKEFLGWMENTILSEKSNKIIAYSDFTTEKHKNKTVGYPRIAVLPSYRGRGLGTLLFWENLKTLKEMGVTKVEINVIGVNFPAVHIYRKAGFKIDHIWYHLRKKL